MFLASISLLQIMLMIIVAMAPVVSIAVIYSEAKQAKEQKARYAAIIKGEPIKY